MKPLQLIAYLILCTSYTCHAMKIIKKKKKEEIIKIEKAKTNSDQSQNLTLKTLNISLSASVLVDRDFLQRAKPDHPLKQDLVTHFIIKGIEWNELQLIKKGIILGGNINYANPTKDNLNFIQIACKEKSWYIVEELLKSPDIKINAYKKNTEPAFFLAVKRGDIKIIDLLIKHDPKIINIQDDNGNRAIHLACKSYNGSYNQYIATKSPDLYKDLTRQEYLIHRLLSATSPYTECVLFKAMLEQKDSTGLQLPKELIAHIMSYYYALNIETIVAKKKYVHQDGCPQGPYYALTIEHKATIKQNLIQKPEPALLWSSL